MFGEEHVKIYPLKKGTKVMYFDEVVLDKNSFEVMVIYLDQFPFFGMMKEGHSAWEQEENGMWKEK